MKKKVLFYVILLASLNVLPASVLAKNILSFSLYTGIEFVASSTEIPSPPSSPETEGTGISLAIDHDNKYSGMDKSYRDGYVPSIKEGCAVILLPLMADGDLVGNALTVTPQLGEPASSPFVFKNYQMTVIKDNHLVNDDASLKASYLISLQLPLKADRINGVYQISIDVRGKGKADGSEVSQSFPTYVIISDGTPPASGEPPEEIPSSQPKVIVNSHSLHPLPVIAGQEFTLVVTLKNTSNMKSIQNMTVDVSCDATNFILLNDSSTIFIGSLGRGATKELLLRYRTDLETPAQQYSIALALSYEDPNASPLTSSGTVPVMVQQSLNVQMEKPQIAPLVNAGDTMLLSIHVMNLGRSRAYNVRMALNAPGLVPTGTAFVGNMDPGTAADGRMDVFVGSKDMSDGYQGDGRFGYTSGLLTLMYEDANGQEFTNSMDISTTIQELPIAAPTAEPGEQQATVSQWWISIAIGVVVIELLAGWLFLRRRTSVK